MTSAAVALRRVRVRQPDAAQPALPLLAPPALEAPAAETARSAVWRRTASGAWLSPDSRFGARQRRWFLPIYGHKVTHWQLYRRGSEGAWVAAGRFRTLREAQGAASWLD